ncbi:MAG TPA: DUF305 domain-containing protein [Vicinamibacteria bacterium]|nr:DUF305 domain-containing protein [Vicinamibacteria bacterium]
MRLEKPCVPRLAAPAVILINSIFALSLIGAVEGQAQEQPPIVQPGAPGAASRNISAEEASNLAGLQYSAADVRFMQGMISHHAQAIEMVALLVSRSDSEAMRQLGKRIELSQEDEIEMMQGWLRERGLQVTSLDAHHAHGSTLMPGMLTPEEMNELENARGETFDDLFLRYMIKHHQGALDMVEELLSERGSAQDSQLYAYTSDITADQTMEIDRMDAMLAGFSPDPRATLAAGFRTARDAVLNLELVASLPKPDGFFDPKAPAGRPRESEEDRRTQARREERNKAKNQNLQNAEQAAKTEGAERAEAAPASEATPAEMENDEEGSLRPGILNFANTDLAFAKGVVIEGNYHGFNAYNVEDPRSPQLLASIVCPGGQGDVSLYGNLLFMSVQDTRGRLDCGTQGVAEPVSAERFRGVRIFDISDLRMPRQVAAVQTCRGSHTHTLVSDPDDEGNIYVYNSGTSGVRSGEELEGCTDADQDPNTALFSIDVIRVPINRPEEARVVSRPRIFADPESGAISGLWKGGDHGAGTQSSRQTNQCHDITVYPELGLAAGACSGNGILIDISDPANPVRLDAVVDPAFAYWHSATFNNDGTKVVFTDEWGGGGRPRCRAFDPANWGANAIFDIVDRKLQFRSYYKLPAPQSKEENCVAHNGSLIPVPGRDIMVQAWYQGGISVFDFTDSERPVEIAFFDRGPIDPNTLVMGGYWSAYWYDGFIYGTEIARGLDVLELLPSEHISQSEIDAAALVSPDIFNAQQQRLIEWPAHPDVARAYLAQLERGDAIAASRSQALTAALDRADELLESESTDAETARRLESLATELSSESASASARDRMRLESLAETVARIAQRLN